MNKPEDFLVADLSKQDSEVFSSSKPLPLFYITVYLIEATRTPAFVIYGDHSTYDAHSVLSIFGEDIGKALYDPDASFALRLSYSLFANAYYNHRTSVPAQLTLDSYSDRFKGIAQHRAGLWPRESFNSVNGSPDRMADQLLLKGEITPVWQESPNISRST